MNEKAEKYEFIVEYNPHRLKITCTEYGEEGKRSQLEYKYNALHKYRGLKYGDIVPWNNSFWCSVTANTSKEAFDIFTKKMEERTNERKSGETSEG